jgi:glucose/arabinose dehydrogenase
VSRGESIKVTEGGAGPYPVGMRKGLALFGFLVLVTAACGGESPSVSPPPSSLPPAISPSLSPSPSAPTSPAGPDLGDVEVRLAEVARLDGTALAMAVREGDDALYIALREGLVMAIRGGSIDPTPVLDVSGQVTAGGEQGLLGLAFAPDGRFVYVNYTDTNGDTNVVEFRMDGDRADPGSARRVLLIDQPFSNHNGGNLAFGPDGYLYIGMGDGGSQGDPDGNGQNLGVLLAKMLRIDPRPTNGMPYGIPPDNPFVGRQGARPEIWAYGLRNPWRYEFDRETGDLWIGDVGGSQREEVDFQTADFTGGANYGWARTEGTVVFDEKPAGWVPPVFEYDTHDNRTCAIVGGFVYRGTAIPDLEGAYLYSDNCNGTINAFVLRDGRVEGQRSLDIDGGAVASFGQDLSGEQYVISLSGQVFRIVPG